MVEDKIIEIIEEQMGLMPGEVEKETTFEELGADELDKIEIMMAIEEDIDVELDLDPDTLDTVGYLIEVVKNKIEEAN